MSSYLQKLRRQSKQFIPQSESKTTEKKATEPQKAPESTQTQDGATTSEALKVEEAKAEQKDPTLFPPVPTVAEPTEEPAAEAVLDEEDKRFLERLAAIADEPEGPAPELPTRPLQVVDSTGQKRVGRDAQEALLDGADKVALPSSPPPVTADTSSKAKGKSKDKGGDLGRRKSVLSYFNLPKFSKKDGEKDKSSKDKDHKTPISAKDREQFADDLQAAADNAKNSELTEAEKEKKELTDILDKLNLSAVNTRVFSFSKESEQLLGKFTQVLKDLINGVPTAYGDLEKLFTDYDNQLKKMYGTLPPFLQNMIKSLPAKLTATVAPGVLAASAEEGGFDAKQAGSSGGKKSRMPVVPNLKSLLAGQGAITTALRSIVNFLKFRFPALATGTNLIMSLAVFGKCVSLFSSKVLTFCSTSLRAVVLLQAW